MPTMMDKAKTLFWQKCSPHSCYVGLSCFLLLSCNLGSAIIAPFFPFLAPDFGVDRSGVALVMSSFSASQIVAALLSGYLASRFGRIPVLVFGALIVALGNLTFGFVPNLISSPSARLVLFCLSRGAQGAGSSFATTVLLAMLTDATPQESRGQVMGFAEFSAASGWTVGPPVGAFLFAAGGWLLPFEILGVLPIIGLVTFTTFHKTLGVDHSSDESPEQTPALDNDSDMNFNELKNTEEPLVSMTEMFWNISTWQLYLTASCSGLIMCSWGMWDLGYSVWLVNEFNLSEEAVGFYFALAPLTYMIGSVPAGAASDTYDPRMVAGTGLVLEGWSFVIAAGWLAPFWPWYVGLASTSYHLRLGLMILGSAFLGAAGTLVIVPCLPYMVEIAQSNYREYLSTGTTLKRSLKRGSDWAHVPNDDEDALNMNGTDGSSLSREKLKDSAGVASQPIAKCIDNEKVTNLVASIFTFAQNLGGFVGPLIGSPLISSFGFRGSACVAGLAMISHGSLVLLVARWTGKKKSTVALLNDFEMSLRDDEVKL